MASHSEYCAVEAFQQFFSRLKFERRPRVGRAKVDDYDACEARLGRTTCVQINVDLAQLYADLDNVADEEGLRYGQYVSRVTERDCV